ncbi:hypothetical protein COS81_04525 [candidate division WWE3 bacterium CG06_land_8_20_14_3_00_42_16]|uniref:Cohesin domain-containing protein n=5 Tax=Katanobacteria TaxID=422282 RepID=A0A2M7ALL9_UNCKA|nr:MAG: hypothetical protein AUJ38_00350 [bacterium CG1_02_42_9]PIU68283.1 MAG: hypothetical protein COS81_04525 [candidate division WWE3 bacterium CG06_land_8_20_14_3_00_42_16]PIZ42079.1 MAG: hypothetical protein COY34_03510 [candidate division WWE3 bacterium CG_4_10_14_0_2_um_filter_42_8]PJC68532.1 MAG: hypothetical protein CO015_03645 [candidate division WWE3 bacterium CG_4_8_14_3_um_filter_42_11]
MIIKKFFSILSVFMLLALNFPAFSVHAATVTNFSDAMSRAKVSVASDHLITFTIADAFVEADTMTLTFASDFAITNVLFTDVDFADDGADLTVVDGAPGVGEIGFAKNAGNRTITFTAGATVNVAAASIITIEIGTNATGPGVNQITNPTTAGSFQVALTGTGFADSGEVDVPIMDDDQVSITATVDTYLLFDLDVAAAHGDSNAPYSISLGELNFAAVTTATDHIFMDLDSNAENGTVIQVKDANNGLLSSYASYTIASASETLTINQDTNDGYGLQNGTFSFTSGAWNESGTYNVDGAVVGAVSTAWSEVANTNSEPIVGGSGEMLVKAVAAKITSAADDYADTLTFRATGMY